MCVSECRTSIVWLIWSAHNMEKLTWIMSSALEDLIWRGYFPLLSPSICICTCIWIWIFNWLKKDYICTCTWILIFNWLKKD
jgi:hypothetical protein